MEIGDIYQDQVTLKLYNVADIYKDKMKLQKFHGGLWYMVEKWVPFSFLEATIENSKEPRYLKVNPKR